MISLAGMVARLGTLTVLTFMSTLAAYIWMGPDIPERTISAAVCGFIGAVLWLVAAKAFESVGRLADWV